MHRLGHPGAVVPRRKHPWHGRVGAERLQSGGAACRSADLRACPSDRRPRTTDEPIRETRRSRTPRRSQNPCRPRRATSARTKPGTWPPRYLRSERVRLAAQALRTITYDQLIDGVNPAEVTRAEVYPLGWEEPGALEWGRHWYNALTEFFEATSAADDALLVWLD
ncbi:DUF1877 family protein [Streptomyces sp. NPDC047043]|uniref:DUF1877 family protein n=1 Tax=Streptomyces sp. NPDC047043 TaxID=3154497 RepID=UPI0033DDFD1C